VSFPKNEGLAMKKWILLLVVLGVLLSQHRWWLRAYAEFFTVDQYSSGADAIVALSGNPITRLPHAFSLQQAGVAPVVLLTEERPRNQRFAHLRPTNADYARAILQEMGQELPFRTVPSLSGGAVSTFDEAYDLLDYARRQGWTRVVIVTDAFHTRRARLAFEKVFQGSGIRIEMAAAPNDIFHEENWWQSDLGLQVYITEGIKYPVYWLTDRNTDWVRND
jgi:uncharacterized SAM-binding protein YcdF (DUF218 family)